MGRSLALALISTNEAGMALHLSVCGRDVWPLYLLYAWPLVRLYSTISPVASVLVNPNEGAMALECQFQRRSLHSLLSIAMREASHFCSSVQ